MRITPLQSINFSSVQYLDIVIVCYVELVFAVIDLCVVCRWDIVEALGETAEFHATCFCAALAVLAEGARVLVVAGLALTLSAHAVSVP